MGALVGGLYASGHSPAEMEKIATSDVFRGVFAMETPYMDANFRRHEDRRELLQAIQFGLKGGLGLRNAVLVDSGLNEFLAVSLNRYNRSELSFDTCANWMRMEAQRHARRIPVNDHTDEREHCNRAQLGEPKLCKRAAILRGQIRQVVGELIEPVHAGTCTR